MYHRKTVDEYEIQGYYTRQYGFETLVTEETYSEARKRLKEYRENEPGIVFNLIKKRIKKGASNE